MSASVRAAGQAVVRRRGGAVTLAAAAVIAAGLVLIGWSVGRAAATWTPLVVPVGIILVVALLRPFEPAPGEKLSLAATVAFFAAAILPAGAAVAAVCGAGVVARLAQRRSLLSSIVNVTVLTAATATARTRRS